QQVVDTAIQADDPGATWPGNTKDVWWRYRLNRSAMLAHDHAAAVKRPVDLAQLNAFYKKWYTPDAMTLFVVGNVDSRVMVEQINKNLSPLAGKR
ncbi:insulinase family protein, partial [Erwinia amylovora]|uniref:insulinase family protein n=1 Tax=Erwinia amylovora TaxID=552 RepID=UPI0020C12F27